MSKEEKLKARLLSLPKDFTFDELTTLLRRLGFDSFNKGATSGSRVAWEHKEKGVSILVHKPHPQKEMRISALKQVLRTLKDEGFI